MNEPLLRVEGVTRLFRSGSTEVHALSDVTMQADAGQFVAIVGRSGSGKTTLLNIIGGLDRPDAGSVFLGERRLSTMSEHELTVLRRKSIGFVFQSFGLLPLLSAYENVELALRIAGVGARERRERAREVLELVGLGKRARHRPYELSGGEQQRVAVARALANRPALLVADEPTGELDSHTAAEIFALLHQITREQGTCVIASTHDTTIREAADQVQQLADGRLVSPEPAVEPTLRPASPGEAAVAQALPVFEPSPQREPAEVSNESLFRRPGSRAAATQAPDGQPSVPEQQDRRS